MLAIADLTWLSLKTLHEQTIIAASQSIKRLADRANDASEGREATFDRMGQAI